MDIESYKEHAHLGNLLADREEVNIAVVAEHFEFRHFDEASIGKMRAPLYGNGRCRYDATLSLTLCELAWYHDASRIEEAPCWDRMAVEKMRKPLIGFSHYRVTPSRIPLLCELAWFHEGLLS